jgi:hypothetical protein
MKDQFGNQVPSDLVIVDIDLRKLVSARQRDAYESVICYQPKVDTRVTLVSRMALVAAMNNAGVTDFTMTTPQASGIDLNRGVLCISRVINWPD